MDEDESGNWNRAEIGSAPPQFTDPSKLLSRHDTVVVRIQESEMSLEQRGVVSVSSYRAESLLRLIQRHPAIAVCVRLREPRIDRHTSKRLGDPLTDRFGLVYRVSSTRF